MDPNAMHIEYVRQGENSRSVNVNQGGGDEDQWIDA